MNPIDIRTILREELQARGALQHSVEPAVEALTGALMSEDEADRILTDTGLSGKAIAELKQSVSSTVHAQVRAAAATDERTSDGGDPPSVTDAEIETARDEAIVTAELERGRTLDIIAGVLKKHGADPADAFQVAEELLASSARDKAMDAVSLVIAPDLVDAVLTEIEVELEALKAQLPEGTGDGTSETTGIGQAPAAPTSEGSGDPAAPSTGA